MIILDPEFLLSYFFDLLSKTADSLLILDFDGTLAPFTIDPKETKPYSGVFRRIKKIMNTCRTHVVIISGRDLESLVTKVPEPYPELWGGHGGERLLMNSSRPISKSLSKQNRDVLKAAASNAEKYAPDLYCESKQFSVALHWRGKDPKTANPVRKGWNELIIGKPFLIQEFDEGFELRVKGIDKGKAVRQLIREWPEKSLIAYLGDDLTDEAAFRQIKNKGLKVLVRDKMRDTYADIYLKPPGELLKFLDCWIDAIQGDSHGKK